MMLYWLAKMISIVVNLLPRKIRLWAGKALGLLMLKLIPAWRREMAMQNIARSLSGSEQETQAIYEASTKRFGNMLVEVFGLPGLKREKLDRFVSFSGEEHLWNALAAGNGCILATSHSGNWELLEQRWRCTVFRWWRWCKNRQTAIWTASSTNIADAPACMSLIRPGCATW